MAKVGFLAQKLTFSPLIFRFYRAAKVVEVTTLVPPGATVGVILVQTQPGEASDGVCENKPS